MQFAAVTLSVHRVRGHGGHQTRAGAVAIELPFEVAVEQSIRAYGLVRDAFLAVAARMGEADDAGPGPGDRLQVDLQCAGPNRELLIGASAAIRIRGAESSALAEACSRLMHGAAAGEFPPGMCDLCIRFPT
jgi:hypothetical protein